MWPDRLGGVVKTVIGVSVRRAWLTITVFMVLTAAALWYCAANIEIDTDNADLLSAELPFRQDHLALKKAFPQLSDNIVIVLEASTPGRVDDAAGRLIGALKESPELFPIVFDPVSDPYFRRNGLLFLEQERLSTLLERLVDSQAFIGGLAADPTLRGLFNLLSLALREGAGDAGGDRLAPFIEQLAEAIQARESGSRRPVSWQDLMSGADAIPGNRRLIVVQPSLDYGSLAPAAAAMDKIRGEAARIGITPENGFRLRLTGSAPMEQEELASVAEGMGLAGMVSLVLVVALLFAAFRSGPMVVATLLTLMAGLIWTAGFATLAVGRFNLISVAFAVLFIGLSVDFAIHLALRIREGIASGMPFAAAAPLAGERIAGALVLCAVSAAIAFFSFAPTSYAGLAELGIIAGAGMFIALFANLTFLPALLSILSQGRESTSAAHDRPPPAKEVWQIRNCRAVIFGAGLLALAAAVFAADARFDFDPINLRNAETESVSTMLELMEGANGTLYAAEVLAPGAAAAKRLAERLGALPSVSRVVWADSFVPQNQAAKLALIDEAAFLILPSLSAPKKPAPAPADIRGAIAEFIAVADALPDNAPLRLKNAARNLAAALRRLTFDAKGLNRLREDLIGSLPGRLSALADGLNARETGMDALPASVRARYIASDGLWRLEVFPEGDAREAQTLKNFVSDVQSVAPRATGAPVIIVEAGRVVIDAFLTAAIISIAAISILVMGLLGGIGNVLLVFAPLSLAAILTGAVSAIAGLPFNFANIIVLPLLFGLGVASAIHLVMRSRTASAPAEIFGTSTPRAVLFSALTTIGSFASIALSSHPGTASMGILLAVAIGLTLICTVILLPALLALRGRAKGGL